MRKFEPRDEVQYLKLVLAPKPSAVGCSSAAHSVIVLTNAEDRDVKKVAKDLLETLKREKLVLDWKKRQTTRAAVRFTIETMLDQLPRRYTPEIYQRKCDVVYQHVFDSFAGQGGITAGG